jgi:hypothetical protein
MNQEEREFNVGYDVEELVNLCICFFEGAPHLSSLLRHVESALANLEHSGDSQDQQVVQIIKDDIYAMNSAINSASVNTDCISVPTNSPASFCTESDVESDSEQ